ncbi:hypothetical protein Syun_006691 [Stephania yunnanensis]|uniref:RING-type domain-containing protein n=1 Tax=Stephania yunnanensis TaxID=152371 RepID=A0AAP0KZP1_9MAGN
MGQQQSKDELLHQQVNYGNVEGIKKLSQDGAGLEWIDKEGKTPLIVACMNPELISVAQALIDLGANVNAFRPVIEAPILGLVLVQGIRFFLKEVPVSSLGWKELDWESWVFAILGLIQGGHAGTPLHHAAKRGLEQSVSLLLSCGANPFLMNDDCQTPLEVARMKGYSNVVRTIESHISYFSGLLRELHGPGFLEALAPQCWVVVTPCGSRNPSKPVKLELALYNSALDAMPRTVIALWKAKIEEPKFRQSDPVVIIYSNETNTAPWTVAYYARGDTTRVLAITYALLDVCSKCGDSDQTMIFYNVPIHENRYKFASASEGDKQQLHCFYNAIRGQPQVMHLAPDSHSTTISASAHTATGESTGLGISSNASAHSAAEAGPSRTHNTQNTDASSLNQWENPAENSDYGGWGAGGGPTPPAIGSANGWADKPSKDAYQGWSAAQAGPSKTGTQIIQENTETLIPSAPPLPEGTVDDLILYPSIDCSPVDLSLPTVKSEQGGTSKEKYGEVASSCVVCLDAAIEGACIPCGHMAGCMSCLNEIKAKKWGCPVCRAKIDQVVRLYAV